MVEKETLIDKVSKHPRIWSAITVAVAFCCILLGTLWLLPSKTVTAEEITSSVGVFTKAEGSLVRCDPSSFEIRNTFCRFFPTGVQYIYLAYTEEGQSVFVRATKDWADSFEEQDDAVKIYGGARAFNNSEKAYIEEEFALSAEGFVDLIYVRLSVMLIISGFLLLVDAGLAALMIKEKIPSQSKGYSLANFIFCTLPIAVIVLWIHLAGFI